MPPFITTPRSVPVEGRMIQPGEMRAIRVRTSCTVDLRLEDGSMQKKTLQTGVFGYLVQRQGSKCLVQLLNDTGQRALCHVPYDTLDVGQLHSQLRVIHPSLQAAQAAAAIAHRRATDPAGRALITIWNSIQKNKDILREVGLQAGVYENILEDEAEKQKCLNVLLASFSNEVWRVLNTTGLPLEPFLNLPKVTPTFPRLKANQILIYLRLYTQPGTTRFAKYGGRTIREFPFVRQTEHDAAIADITCVSPHYREARNYSARDRHAIPMMILTDSRKSVMAMAEMTLCCLLRTWSPSATNFSPDSVSEAVSSGSMSHRLLTSTFSKIVDNALEKTQYPLFGGVGCNWSCPLQEGQNEKREWLRYRVINSDNRPMLVYRWQSHVTRLRGGLGARVIFKGFSGQKWFGFELTKTLDHLAGIAAGRPLIISIEVMEDGKPHPLPWYRHPHHGAWDNSHELHSFGIRAEWMDEATKQWYTYPLQHDRLMATYPGSKLTVTRSWRTATMILQFLHNRRYRNPPKFLPHLTPNIKEVVFDHLTQTVSLKQVGETILDPPKEVSWEENMWSLAKASKTIWPGILVGAKPSEGWFSKSGAGPKETMCVLCRAYANYRSVNPITPGCSSRDGDFSIASSEPKADDIRENSCRLCWEYYRRPCIWTPHGLTRRQNEEEGTNKYMVLSPGFEGIAMVAPYNGPATKIAAPMTLEMYYEAKEKTEAEMLDDAGPDNIEDDDD